MSDFIFQWPSLLSLGILVLPLLAILARARRARQRLAEAMGEQIRTHRALRDHLRVLAFLLMVLALARPGYAPEPETASRSARDVVFALDVSRSMLAQDVAPSRLEVAKQGIRDALEVLDGHRVALVVYGGSASILCPLSYDHDFVRFMLDQAEPRTVEFGGTTLQSAVEKVVDQVMMEDRKGGHDLVVLTDGGDHGSNTAAVVAHLEAMQVDTLIVGLGDPEQGSPIPVGDGASAPTFLELDGATVYTRLEAASILELASASPRIEYFAAGTGPFNLGQQYLEYSSDKPSPVLVLDSAVLVYREAAFFFIMLAVLLLIFSDRWGLHGLRLAATALLLMTAHPRSAKAADDLFLNQFEAAIELLDAGDFAEAEQRFGEIFAAETAAETNREVLAVVQFNRGLCLIQLARGEATKAPVNALSRARAARDAFLLARRLDPRMDRAGIRLASTGQLIEELEAAVDEQADDQDREKDQQASKSAEESSSEDEAAYDPSGESQSSSEMGNADLAASSEMQALPQPNYSAEDILQEEQGNRQFREQKRAGANAGQVEKDY